MENQILFIAGKKLCCDEFLLTAKIIQRIFDLKKHRYFATLGVFKTAYNSHLQRKDTA